MSTAFYTHPDCRLHQMGRGHPECPERLDAIADHLRATGLDIALDMRDAPFDVVKLPVTFVLRSATAYDDAVIAAGVGFARAIGAETVAEGIETVVLRDRVRALGIDIGQGFLWSPIVRAEQLPEVIGAIGINGAIPRPIAGRVPTL